MAASVSSQVVLTLAACPPTPRNSLPVSSAVGFCRSSGSVKRLAAGHIHAAEIRQRRTACDGIRASASSSSDLASTEEKLNGLEGIKLYDPSGAAVSLVGLSESRPAVVAFARHFGCILWRKRAEILQSRKVCCVAVGHPLIQWEGISFLTGELAQRILSGDGRGQQGDSILTSLKESTSRSGRRGFSRSCLVALAVYTIMGRIGGAIAVETQSKPEKKKGRAPSSRFDEDRLLEQNRRMQRLNNAPTEFPGFVREGFQVKVITSEKYVTSRSGLIYYDMVVGQGDLPQDGQQVIFHYTGYNESGRRVDSSYQQGRPARTRLGIQGMIPGFEEGIKTMRAGGRRIIIVPPELGPPVGPSTFFSAKQFEVFDVELLEAKDCSRRTLLFYSDVVCD